MLQSASCSANLIEFKRAPQHLFLDCFEVLKREIFGPIIPILAVSSVDEVDSWWKRLGPLPTPALLESARLLESSTVSGRSRWLHTATRRLDTDWELRKTKSLTITKATKVMLSQVRTVEVESLLPAVSTHASVFNFLWCFSHWNCTYHIEECKESSHDVWPQVSSGWACFWLFLLYWWCDSFFEKQTYTCRYGSRGGVKTICYIVYAQRKEHCAQRVHHYHELSSINTGVILPDILIRFLKV